MGGMVDGITDEVKEKLKGHWCTDKYPDKNANIHPDAQKVRPDPTGLLYRCPHCGFEGEGWWPEEDEKGNSNEL